MLGAASNERSIEERKRELVSLSKYRKTKREMNVEQFSVSEQELRVTERERELVSLCKYKQTDKETERWECRRILC